jgi:hypothetical protein
LKARAKPRASRLCLPRTRACESVHYPRRDEARHPRPGRVGGRVPSRMPLMVILLSPPLASPHHPSPQTMVIPGSTKQLAKLPYTHRVAEHQGDEMIPALGEGKLG